MPTSNDLTTWLAAHRLDLSISWADVISEPSPPLLADQFDDEGAVATISSTSVSVDQLYDALVLAAGGDYAALSARVHAISHSDDIRDQALNERLGRAFDFRRTFRTLLHRHVSDPASALEMFDAFDVLFEYLLGTLADSWAAHNAEVIREREFIAESLELGLRRRRPARPPAQGPQRYLPAPLGQPRA